MKFGDVLQWKDPGAHADARFMYVVPDTTEYPEGLQVFCLKASPDTLWESDEPYPVSIEALEVVS